MYHNNILREKQTHNNIRKVISIMDYNTYCKNVISYINNNVLKNYDYSIIRSRSTYTYNGIIVPRVSEILDLFGENTRSLLIWSNKLGLNGERYIRYTNDVTNKGTLAHESIEKFLIYREELDIKTLEQSVAYQVENAYNSFRIWWDEINQNNKVSIINIEEELICKYFGGKYDCLLDINGKKWLIDFKTSNYFNIKQILQLGAYTYLLKTCKNIDIDGILILKVSKNSVHYEERILDFSVNEHRKFMNECINHFLLMVASYYGRNRIEYGYEQLFGKDH